MPQIFHQGLEKRQAHFFGGIVSESLNIHRNVIYGLTENRD